jgi:hypothetical protein
MAMTEDISEEDVVVPPIEEITPPSDVTQPYDPPNIYPMISLNSLIGFSPLETLKLIGYIKNRKFITLVDNGTKINFIHHCIT